MNTSTKVTTLKKSSNDIARLTSEINKINKPESQNFKNDEGYWKPKVDKMGNGYAVIRFCNTPAIDGDDGLPWVRYFDHGFKGPTGSWYIENSLTSLGQKDPVSELNTILWNSGNESDKKIARDQKRRLHFVSVIEVIKDAAQPECEGNFYKFRYGKKIFRKIEEQMNPGVDEEGNPIPGEEDAVPVNPFDFWEGANFHLKIRKVEGYPNYDKSYFDAPSRIRKTDKEITELWEKLPSLKVEVAPDKFKPYATLKAKLNAVLGISDDTAKVVQSVREYPKVKTTTDFEDGEPEWKTPSTVSTLEDDDPIMAELQSLANPD